MQRDLVSVIIPVYNVKEYLTECLESVLNQSYSNLEVILINDGSTDKSGEICDYYEKTDERIKVIHKRNGGLSDARNIGLDNCAGKFICFVDSDDYIHRDFIKVLYESLKTNKVDISLSSFSSVKLSDKIDFKEFKRMSFEEFFFEIKSLPIKIIVCNKLYKKEIWDKVRFENCKLHEDVYAFLKTTYNRTFVYTPQELYFYRERKGSITNMPSEKSFIDSTEGFMEILNFFERNDRKYSKVILNELIYLNVRYFYQYGRNKTRTFLKKYWFIILCSNKYSFKEKIFLYVQLVKM